MTHEERLENVMLKEFYLISNYGEFMRANFDSCDKSIMFARRLYDDLLDALRDMKHVSSSLLWTSFLDSYYVQLTNLESILSLIFEWFTGQGAPAPSLKKWSMSGGFGSQTSPIYYISKEREEKERRLWS